MGWTTLSEEGTCALSGRNLQALDVTSEAEMGKFRGWDWMDISLYLNCERQKKVEYVCVEII